MFVLRSAFWLTVGFLLVAPHGTDFGAAATSLRDQAVGAGIDAGKQLIATQATQQALPQLIDIVIDVKPSHLEPESQVPAPRLPLPRPAALG